MTGAALPLPAPCPAPLLVAAAALLAAGAGSGAGRANLRNRVTGEVTARGRQGSRVRRLKRVRGEVVWSSPGVRRVIGRVFLEDEE